MVVVALRAANSRGIAEKEAEQAQCGQFDRYDGHCRAIRIGLLGSRYSEISTAPTLLNPHSPDNALSFGAACAIQI
jgi:hypothetical protein